MRTWRSRVAGVLLAMALTIGCAAAAMASPAPPTSDPFYSYSGSLANVAPGTVLKTRMVTVAIDGLTTPVSSTQVLYRTTSQLGEPEVTVATIIKPLTGSLTRTKLLAYQIAYDCDTPTGRPSYQLTGGTPFSEYTWLDATPSMIPYLAQGYTIVTSDYEGPNDEYGAGLTSGYATLDSIRAAESSLDLSSGTPVGLEGYSGGSIATMWALHELPTYAPELNVVGAATGGIPVDYANLVNYVSGTQAADVVPSVMEGLFRAYDFNPAPYFNATGLKDLTAAGGECLSTDFSGITMKSILQPQDQDWEAIPALATILNAQLMSAPAKATVPLIIGAGDSDGKGDGIMVDADMQELAHEYCLAGDKVSYETYEGLNHVEAAEAFTTTAAPLFLNEAFAGDEPNGCSSITPGSSLTPLPVATAATPRPVLHSLGVSVSLKGLVLRAQVSSATLSRVTIELTRGATVVARASIARLTTRTQRVILRSHGEAPARGRYTLTVLVGGHVVSRRVYIVSK